MTAKCTTYTSRPLVLSSFTQAKHRSPFAKCWYRTPRATMLRWVCCVPILRLNRRPLSHGLFSADRSKSLFKRHAVTWGAKSSTSGRTKPLPAPHRSCCVRFPRSCWSLIPCSPRTRLPLPMPLSQPKPNHIYLILDYGGGLTTRNKGATGAIAWLCTAVSTTQSK